jgi:hypothetical protein
MRKFSYQLVLFFILLTAIPSLIVLGLTSFAKLLGILTLVLLSLLTRFWLYQSKKHHKHVQIIRFNTNDRFWLKRHIPFYNSLKRSDKLLMESRMGLFVSRVPLFLSSGQPITQRELVLHIAATIIERSWEHDNLAEQFPDKIIVDTDKWAPIMRDFQNKKSF